MGYIGSDESGKGDVFGPLVVSAVYLDNNVEEQLGKYKIRDSKMIADSVILELAAIIRQYTVYETLIYTPFIYNAEYIKYNNQQLLMVDMYEKTINRLVDHIDPKSYSHVIIDKFTSHPIVINNIEPIVETKAEKHKAVACASILARAEVVEWFKDHPDLHKGSSRSTFELIKNYTPAQLTKIQKLHFRIH